MKKIILTLLISMIAVATYIIAPIEPNIAIAGIKKGTEKPQFSYTQNIKLPDFDYNTIVNVINSYREEYHFRGFSNNPSTWFETREIIVTDREVGLVVHQNVFLGSIYEGDVTINQYRDEYEHLMEKISNITDHYGYTEAPPPSDPIVVDLDLNGVTDVSKGINTPHNFFDKSKATLFDLNADGVKDLME